MAKVARAIFFLSSLFVSLSSFCQSQLRTKLSVGFDQMNLESSLDKLSAETDLIFSYNPNSIPIDKMVAGSFDDMTLEDILSELLGEGFTVKNRSKYIIIQPSRAETRTTYRLTGKVVDQNTGNEIADASVFEVNTLSAALSGDGGEYDLRVASKYQEASFIISKQYYQDTLIRVAAGQNFPESISLRPQVAGDSTSISPVDKSSFFKTMVADRIRKHMQNVDLGEKRAFQLSLFPVLGTNGILAGKITNHVSLNLTAGLAYGVEGAEFAGALNIIRKDVKGAQFAGGANFVGGNVTGTQMAGAVNVNLGDAKGALLAGAVNVNIGDVTGTQMAGTINQMSGNFKGFQGAGMGNWAGGMVGLQTAGLINYAHNDVKGVQIAGMTNYSRAEVNGLQISSLLNYAGTLRGVQIAVVNVVDNSQGGISIGLINIVRNGLKRFEVSHEGVSNYNFSFRTGTEVFYNVISVGIQNGETGFWNYGLGFGSQFELKNKFFGNVEVSSRDFKRLEGKKEGNFSLNQLNLNVGYRLGGNWAIVGGPTFNVYVKENGLADPFGLEPGWLLFDEPAVSMWIGYRLGIRF